MMTSNAFFRKGKNGSEPIIHLTMRKNKFSFPLLLVPIVLPLLLLGGGLYWITQEKGFSIGKISSSFEYNREWEVDSLPDKQHEILVHEVFPQKYHYLTEGNQSYVFVSEDQKYILKFFKIRSLTPKRLFKREKQAPLFPERIFNSYKNAYEDLRDETGLLYIHFNKTREFKTKVTLIDSQGKAHLLDIDNVEFVVQRRAQEVFDHLVELVKEEKYEELRISIHSFLQLIADRCQKGFVDPNLNLQHDFGFVGNHAIQLDCATLIRDNSMKYPLNFRYELMQVAERLDDWAQESCPQVSVFIQEETQRLINQLF